MTAVMMMVVIVEVVMLRRGSSRRQQQQRRRRRRRTSYVPMNSFVVPIWVDMQLTRCRPSTLQRQVVEDRVLAMDPIVLQHMDMNMDG